MPQEKYVKLVFHFYGLFSFIGFTVRGYGSESNFWKISLLSSYAMVYVSEKVEGVTKLK